MATNQNRAHSRLYLLSAVLKKDNCGKTWLFWRRKSRQHDLPRSPETWPGTRVSQEKVITFHTASNIHCLRLTLALTELYLPAIYNIMPRGRPNTVKCAVKATENPSSVFSRLKMTKPRMRWEKKPTHDINTGTLEVTFLMNSLSFLPILYRENIFHINENEDSNECFFIMGFSSQDCRFLLYALTTKMYSLDRTPRQLDKSVCQH